MSELSVRGAISQQSPTKIKNFPVMQLQSQNMNLRHNNNGAMVQDAEFTPMTVSSNPFQAVAEAPCFIPTNMGGN